MLTSKEQFLLNEHCEIDNLLIRQKDLILFKINWKAFGEAEAMLSVVREMWTTLNYGYKYRELMNQIHSSK